MRSTASMTLRPNASRTVADETVSEKADSPTEYGTRTGMGQLYASSPISKSPGKGTGKEAMRSEVE